MKSLLELRTQLESLNNLLIQERNAIIGLRMQELEEIRQEKIGLITIIHTMDKAVDDSLDALIEDIRKNNDRNRKLLKSGLKMISKMQDNMFRNMALTYAPRGELQIGAGSRVLSRSA